MKKFTHEMDASMSTDDEVFELRRNEVRMSDDKRLKHQMKLIEHELEKARDAIKKAMEIADKNGLIFHWNPPAMDHGEGSGMGGWYYGEGNKERERGDGYGEPGPDGWLASSRSC